jgi:hypothetical protein
MRCRRRRSCRFVVGSTAPRRLPIHTRRRRRSCQHHAWDAPLRGGANDRPGELRWRKRWGTRRLSARGEKHHQRHGGAARPDLEGPRRLLPLLRLRGCRAGAGGGGGIRDGGGRICATVVRLPTSTGRRHGWPASTPVAASSSTRLAPPRPLGRAPPRPARIEAVLESNPDRVHLPLRSLHLPPEARGGGALIEAVSRGGRRR